MAPRNKFTREEMIEAALRVVQKKGSSALTARAIADELGVSTQPIFTCFNTMEEAQKEVRIAAKKRYRSYVSEGLQAQIPFLLLECNTLSLQRKNRSCTGFYFLKMGRREQAKQWKRWNIHSH